MLPWSSKDGDRVLVPVPRPTNMTTQSNRYLCSRCRAPNICVAFEASDAVVSLINHAFIG